MDERLVFWQYADTDGALERQLSYIANHQATAGDYTAGEVTRLTYDAYGVPGQASEGQQLASSHEALLCQLRKPLYRAAV